MRLSTDKSQKRWDGKYIDQQLQELNCVDVKKIWVCGPSMMNETFDKSLKSLCPKYNISQNAIEIM